LETFMGDTRARWFSLPLSLSLLATAGFAAGCGDNIPKQTDGGIDGGGGVAGASGGVGGEAGSLAGAGGSAGAAGRAGAGGATGGIGGLGGHGGAGGGGGAGGLGGHGGAGGGGGVGGLGGHGGAGGGGGVGGLGGSGGSTGGAGATGGSVATGVGGNTGGVGGNGGAGAIGGSGGAGAPGGSGGAGIPCYTTAFTAPASGATLTVSDDADHTCSNGLQYTVTISSSAPDGTDVSLYDGTTLLKTVQTSGGAASFAVQLPSAGTTSLAIQYPGTLACSVSENVTVSCPNSPPTCTISAPTISASHPALNGVQAPAGDRTSSAGSTYQATFVVTTSAEDGRPVTLSYDNTTTPAAVTTVTATASGGTATFGVPLSPDGTYSVAASCTNLNGITGTSTSSSFPVDTTPPILTVNSPTAGQFFSTLTNGAFQACAQTSSADAAGLSSSLGTGQQNLCVSVGSSATPSCTAVGTVNTSTCLNIPCPGAAPFSLTFSLTDAAGNPTSQTVTGVSCASALPSVQIVSPVSDSPGFNDSSKHILSATAPVGVHDEDPNTAGAQADVVACTDTIGSATLLAGHVGDAQLSPVGGAVNTVVAGPADNCPAGYAYVARFSGVTLPQSTETATGVLAAATRLEVSVSASSNAADVGTSSPDDVWVDTTPPNLGLVSPNGLCGSFTQSSTAVVDTVTFASDYTSVVLTVNNGGTTTTYNAPAFASGVATFSGVVFTQGSNILIATETDPAGNATTLIPAPCTVTIGSAPVVTFTTPLATNVLCPSTGTSANCLDDTAAGTPGWQGNITVNVTTSAGPVSGSTITFSIGSTTLGTGVTDASGNATLVGVTLPDGTDTILATTDNVPGAGVGSNTVTVTVDTGAPNAPTGLSAVVSDRRKTSVRLTWTAPSDGGGGTVAGYQVRYAKVPITAANFDDTTVTTAVPYTGQPTPPGQIDGIAVSGLYIENGYYFAVEATNVAGTRSTLVATTTAVTAHFNVTIINSPAGTPQSFGNSIDGSADVNGDGVSDLLVGTFNDNHAYLFFGVTGGTTFAPTAPGVTFTGANIGFGAEISAIGDIDHDGLEDIAIADFPIGQRVFIFKGRLSWPLTLTDAQADYVVTTSAAYAGSNFGSSIARLGDFDGDGVDDFAIGAPLYNTRVGRVAVVYGRAGFTSFSLPDATNTRALEIGGDPALTRSQLGISVVGLGHFYSVTTGTTLIASATGLGAPSNTSNNEGRLYAFHGRSPGAAIDASSADNVVVGPQKGAEIGQVLSNLGPVENAANTLGSGNTVDTFTVPGASGTAYILSGTSATGPFANRIVLYKSGAASAGQILFGGGFSGRDAFVSIIGDAKPDIAISSTNVSTVDILDGSKISALTSPADTTSVADVHVPLPSGWSGTPTGPQNLIGDINGDGYPDFALGDIFGAVPGRVAVFW
jgi:FG-GAP repeat protein/fibronectin type III domain protein/VCBS repeat protein